MLPSGFFPSLYCNIHVIGIDLNYPCTAAGPSAAMTVVPEPPNPSRMVSPGLLLFVIARLVLTLLMNDAFEVCVSEQVEAPEIDQFIETQRSQPLRIRSSRTIRRFR